MFQSNWTACTVCLYYLYCLPFNSIVHRSEARHYTLHTSPHNSIRQKYTKHTTTWLLPNEHLLYLEDLHLRSEGSIVVRRLSGCLMTCAIVIAMCVGMCNLVSGVIGEFETCWRNRWSMGWTILWYNSRRRWRGSMESFLVYGWLEVFDSSLFECP